MFAGDVIRALQGDWSAYEQDPPLLAQQDAPKRTKRRRHSAQVIRAKHVEPIDLDQVPPAPREEAAPAIHVCDAEPNQGDHYQSSVAEEGPCYFLGPVPTPKNRFAPVPVRPVFSPQMPAPMANPYGAYSQEGGVSPH